MHAARHGLAMCQMTMMQPMNPESPPVKSRSSRTSTVIVLYYFIIVQIVMLVVMSIFDYTYIFPSRSGLDLGHYFLFLFIYVIALIGGFAFALRRRQWTIALAQVAMPFLLFTWLTWPRSYDPAKYQTLVGKTKAEVDEIIGRGAGTGFGCDEEGTYTHYNGMKIRYFIVHGTKSYPAKNDRVKAVDPN